jgi:hypothetical protein
MEIQNHLNICDLNEEKHKQNRNFYEHTSRMNQNTLPKALFNFELEAQRETGRAKKTER